MNFLLFLSSEWGNLESGKIQIYNIVLNFPALDFLIQKIKEWEIQNSFYHSLPYFSIFWYDSDTKKNYSDNLGTGKSMGGVGYVHEEEAMQINTYFHPDIGYLRHFVF